MYAAMLHVVVGVTTTSPTLVKQVAGASREASLMEEFHISRPCHTVDRIIVWGTLL